MIVADTGAIVALVDARDRDHAAVRALHDEHGAEWLLPWAILAEVDYLLSTHVGERAARAFFADVAAARFTIEPYLRADVVRAHELDVGHRALRLGLVDTVVMAIAERLTARAVITLDERHFGAVKLRGRPKLLPRDA